MATLHETYQLAQDGVTQGRVKAALWAFAVAQLAGATRDDDKDALSKLVLRTGEGGIEGRALTRSLLSYGPVDVAAWVNDVPGDAALATAIDNYVGALIEKGVLNVTDPDAPPAP